ncbi:tRNA dimethylallyltransferase 9, partial [Linum perenne]
YLNKTSKSRRRTQADGPLAGTTSGDTTPPAYPPQQHSIWFSSPPEKMLCSQLSIPSRCLRCFLRPFASSSASVTAEAKKKGKVVVITGPTGAGKSRLALELAKQLNGEIVSADSVQMYRGLDIGSAKPSHSEREVLPPSICRFSVMQEVPHHLINILDPYEDYSVGQFFRDARKATQDILDRGSVPIVVGGTGLYLRWFIYGKPDVPQATVDVASEVHSELAELQRNHDWGKAVQLLVKAGDPRAEDVPVNNWYRLRRSLEIIKASGLPPSTFKVPYDSFKEKPISNSTDSSSSGGDVDSKDLDYEFLCFFLSSPRLDLYRSIDHRCEVMLSDRHGLLSEAKMLLDMGLNPSSNSATRAIGYRQAMEYLLRSKHALGSSTGNFLAFLADFQKASRNFAKRQLTWFRNENIYHWLDASKPMEKVMEFVYDAYHDQPGTLVVPESLRMPRYADRQERLQLKAYMAKNRHFVDRDSCSETLRWISEIQSQPAVVPP